jgi:hypothetical protein
MNNIQTKRCDDIIKNGVNPSFATNTQNSTTNYEVCCDVSVYAVSWEYRWYGVKTAAPNTLYNELKKVKGVQAVSLKIK